MTQTREIINFWLHYYGVPEEFEIEIEAEQGILEMLQNEQLETVFVEGAELVFEFKEEQQEC